jgi:hypothetical protein
VGAAGGRGGDGTGSRGGETVSAAIPKA